MNSEFELLTPVAREREHACPSATGTDDAMSALRRLEILQSVLAAELRRASALVARDVGALEGCLHDDLVYVHATGVRHGKDELLRFLDGEGAPRFIAVQLLAPQVYPVGKGALLHGELNMTLQRAEPVPIQAVSWVSALWVRGGADDGWQLRLFQSTRVAT